MPDITVNEGDQIDLLITQAETVEIDITEGSDVSVNITEPAPQVITVYPQLNITSINDVESDLNQYLQLGDTDEGNWEIVEVQNTSTSGVTFSGGLMTAELLDNAGRIWVRNEPVVSGAGGGSPTVQIIDHDYLFNWTGYVDQFDTTSSVVVGFMRTHGGATEEESFERLVGFYADRTTETWVAAIWRPTVPNTSAYSAYYSEDTGLSIYDSHHLSVVVCNNGTRAIFFTDGDHLSTQDDNLPVVGDNSTFGAKLFYGIHLRDYDDAVSPTVYPSLVTSEMDCRRYDLGSVLTHELGGGPPTGAAGGDLTGTYPNPQIASGAVGTPELASFSVTTIKIATGAVTNAKINDGELPSTKIGSDALGYPTVMITDTTDTYGQWAKMNNLSVNYALSIPEVSVDLTGLSAGGDLQGTYPNPTVHKIHGHNMQSGNPSDNDVWTYHNASAEWQHRSLASAGISAVGHTHTMSEITDLPYPYDPTNPTSPVWFVDEFYGMSTEAGEIGDHGWTVTNATATSGQSETNHPGIVIVRCSGTINTIGTLTLSPTSSSNGQYAYGDWKEMTVVFKCLETDTDTLRILGMMSSFNSTTPTDGIFIRKSAAFGVWQAVTRASSSETVSGTNLWTQDTNWHKIKIVKNGSSVEFYVDGATSPTTTISTNIPSSSVIMYPVYMNQPTAGSLVRRNTIDFWSFKLNGLTR